MKDKKLTIEAIKRQAKKLRKELSITHTEALDILSKQAGYSNWIHCLRSLNEQPANDIVPAAALIDPTFTEWLTKYKNRDSPLGDLASDMLRDRQWPAHYNTLDEFVQYIRFKTSYPEVMRTLKEAWRTYQAYLKRKRNPALAKAVVKKPVSEVQQDLRRVVYVKNVTPLHFMNRTVETFAVGDQAWVSYDGSKAVPVTIVEVDEIYYMFRKNRPLKDVKGTYYLRLDEVRSTPELACLNCVSS